jgi:hypothetical protein
VYAYGNLRFDLNPIIIGLLKNDDKTPAEKVQPEKYLLYRN